MSYYRERHLKGASRTFKIEPANDESLTAFKDGETPLLIGIVFSTIPVVGWLRCECLLKVAYEKQKENL